MGTEREQWWSAGNDLGRLAGPGWRRDDDDPTLREGVEELAPLTPHGKLLPPLQQLVVPPRERRSRHGIHLDRLPLLLLLHRHLHDPELRRSIACEEDDAKPEAEARRGDLNGSQKELEGVPMKERLHQLFPT